MAAQSTRLTQEEANLRAELGDLLWTLLSDAEHAEAVARRLAIVHAVADGQPGQARQLAEQLIARETELLMQWRIDLYRAEGGAAASSPAEQAWGALAGDVERIFQDVRDTAAAFEASFAARPGGYALTDIASLRPRIRATLDAFGDMVVGTGIVAAPGVVGDAPYWLEWWWRQGKGNPEALHVNLDPDAPDFYDYINDEWFRVPVRSGRAHVTGPYVDYACTNQYTFTLSVPAYRAGRPLGVAATDIPFDSLERRIMPALCAEAAPSALLSASGRVIAANEAGPAPGDQLAGRGDWPEAARPAALTRLCALTGWMPARLA
jgi:hypothetical protein